MPYSLRRLRSPFRCRFLPGLRFSCIIVIYSGMNLLLIPCVCVSLELEFGVLFCIFVVSFVLFLTFCTDSCSSSRYRCRRQSPSEFGIGDRCYCIASI